MIIGNTESMDGLTRRIPIRHTQIVSKETKIKILSYIENKVYEKCLVLEWININDIFPQIPNDLVNTPLEIIYKICSDRFGNDHKLIRLTISKYLGMLIRESIYYSEKEYIEKINGSIRTYSLHK